MEARPQKVRGSSYNVLNHFKHDSSLLLLHTCTPSKLSSYDYHAQHLQFLHYLVCIRQSQTII